MAKITLRTASPDDPIFSEGSTIFVPVSRRSTASSQPATDGVKTPHVNGKTIDPLPTLERDSALPDPAQGLMDDMDSLRETPDPTKP